MAARKKVTPEVPRFCIVADDSGHDYFIPAEKKEAWYHWSYGTASEFEDVPEYATRIDGRFTFADPKVD